MFISAALSREPVSESPFAFIMNTPILEDGAMRATFQTADILARPFIPS